MDSAERTHFFAVLNRLHANFTRQCCLHPNANKDSCNGKSRAHTIQRSGVLDSIAINGHVGQLRPAMDPESGPGIAEMELVGLREASTFPGLCNKHDTELFRPIETELVTFRRDQIFLFSYRALLREYFTKLQAQNQLKFMRAYLQKHELRNPMNDMYLEGSSLGTDHGFAALAHHKKIYDECLKYERFDEIRSVVIKYDRKSPLLCAGAFSPEYTYDGELLQDLADLNFIQDFISISIWNVEHRGVAIIAWHSSSDHSCRPFAKSLLKIPNKRLPARLASLAFEHSENVFFSPTWWDAIPRKNKLIFARRMGSGLPLTDRKPNYLKDDLHTAISAEATRITVQMP